MFLFQHIADQLRRRNGGFHTGSILIGTCIYQKTLGRFIGCTYYFDVPAVGGLKIEFLSLQLLHSFYVGLGSNAEELGVSISNVARAHDVAHHVHVLRLGDDGLGAAAGVEIKLLL